MPADGDSNNDPELLESDTDDSINVVEDASQEPSWVTLAQRAAQGMQELQRWQGPVDLEALRACLGLCLRFFEKDGTPDAAPEALLNVLVRPFLRDQIQASLHRLTHCSENDLGFWRDTDHALALCVLSLLASLVTAMLRRHFGAPAQGSQGAEGVQPAPAPWTVEARLDMAGATAALAQALSPLAPFNVFHRFSTLENESSDVLIHPFTYAAPPGYGTYHDPLALPQPNEAQHLWTVNLVNHFGSLGGFRLLYQALRTPDRVGLEGCQQLLSLLAPAAALLQPAWRQAAGEAVHDVLTYVEQGFATAPGLTAFEEGGTPRGGAGPASAGTAGGTAGAAGGSSSATVNCLLWLVGHAEAVAQQAGGAAAVAAMVCPVRCELLLRLLRSNSFNRQLAAVRDLGTLLQKGAEAEQGGSPEMMQATLHWLREGGVVRQVLKQNLHQAQYAEQAQKVLRLLLRYGALADDDLAFLWNLTQDGTTFEGVRANVYSMLGQLAPQLKAEQQAELFSKLEARGRCSGVGDGLKIINLLLAMAQADPQGGMMEGLLGCLLRLVLRREAPAEVVQSGTVAEVCCLYDEPTEHRATHLVADACIKAWTEEGGGAAVPAAFVLHSLFGTVLQKQGRQDAFFKRYNRDADLLRLSLNAYDAYLRRLKAGEGAAAAGGAGVSQPGDGISHAAAVREWHALLAKVVHLGNWFLLLNQLQQMLRWATELAPTPDDSSASWELLSNMVLGRKEVMRDVAASFYRTKLCALPPHLISRPAWRCFAAYTAALGQKPDEWSRALDGERDLLPQVAVSETNFQPGVEFMWRAVLEGPSEVLFPARLLLARFVGPLFQQRYPAERCEAVMTQQLRCALGELQHAADVLLGPAWRQQQQQQQHGHDNQGAEGAPAAAPAAGAGGASAPGADVAMAEGAEGASGAPAMSPAEARLAAARAAQRAERVLELLRVLVQESIGQYPPCVPSHAASHEELPLTIHVQLPAPQKAARGTSLTLHLPSNAYVWTLRKEVADRLGVAVNRVRMMGGGLEFNVDNRLLNETRLGSATVLCSLLPADKANAYSLGNAKLWGIGATHLIQTQVPGVYEVALALAATPQVNAGTAGKADITAGPGAVAPSQLAAGAAAAEAGAAGTASASCCAVARRAADLLGALPTAVPVAQSVAALLGGPAGPAGTADGTLHNQETQQAQQGEVEVAAALAALLSRLSSRGADADGNDRDVATAGGSERSGTEDRDAAVQPQDRRGTEYLLQYVIQAICAQLFPNPLPGPAAAAAASAAAARAAAAPASPTSQQAAQRAAEQERRRHLAALFVTSGGLACLLRTLSALPLPAEDPLAAASAHAAMLLLLRHLRSTLGSMPSASNASGQGAAQQGTTQQGPGAEGGAGPARMEASTGTTQRAASDSMAPSEDAMSADPPGGPPRETGGDPGVPAAPAEQQGASSAMHATSGGEPAGSATMDKLSYQLTQQALGMSHLSLDAAAALRTLGPAVLRYLLRMLCAALAGFTAGTAASLEVPLGHPITTRPPLNTPPASAGAQGAVATAPRAKQQQQLLERLCSQGLALVAAMSEDDSSLVHGATAEPELSPLVTALLHHPSPSLRTLAGEWLRQFAALDPAAHHWAFSKVVLPLLLGDSRGTPGDSPGDTAGDKAGSTGPANGRHGSASSVAASEAGGATQQAQQAQQGGIGQGCHEEQVAFSIQFIQGLDENEAPLARELLRTLLDRLMAAIASGGPLEGLATLVLALLQKLDCRGSELTRGLVQQLICNCLLPEIWTLGRFMLRQSQLAQQAQPADLAGVLAAELAPHWRLVERAARRSERCREAAFRLLEELMLHDDALWAEGCQLLLSLHNLTPDLFRLRWKNHAITHLRQPGHFAGLHNGGATCYMSSIFQQLYMQPTIRRLVLAAPAVRAEEQQDSVFHQLQTMFAHLAYGVEPWFEPRGFWRAFKDYDGQPVNIREHQDAYEFFTRLQDGVDEHLRGAGAVPAIHAALGGTFAQLITVTGQPEQRSERDEDFYQISLDVRGKRTLGESLQSYVQRELMDGENQWFCEALGKKVDAEKRTLIKALPPTLVFHLKRFEWDYETYQRWKVKDRFEFPLALDMTQYTLEGAGAAMPGQAVPRPDSYYHYELRGVVVHSGTAFAGHYYSYIKDRGPGGQWYCFDDTHVDPWDHAKLAVECFGGKYTPEGVTQEYDRPNSAYMLFYERTTATEEEAGAAAAAVAAAGDATASAAAAPEEGRAVPAAAAAAEPATAAAVPAMPAVGPGTPAGPAPMDVSGGSSPAEGAADAAAVPTAAPAVGSGVPAGAATAGTAVPALPAEHSAAPAEGRGGDPQPMAASPIVPAPGGNAAGHSAAGAQQAQPIMAQAADGEGDLPLAPPLLCEVLLSNMRKLGELHVVGSDYQGFMHTLALEVRAAVNGGKPRKAARTDNPRSSPGQGPPSGPPPEQRPSVLAPAGPAALGRGRSVSALPEEEEGAGALALCTTLLIDYLIRVVARGPKELVLSSGLSRKSGGGCDLAGALHAATEHSAAAAVALLGYMGSPATFNVAMQFLMHCPWDSLANSVTRACIAAIAVLRRAEAQSRVLPAVRQFVEAVCGTLLPTLTVELRGTAGPPWRFSQLLHMLYQVARQGRAGRALLDTHIEAIMRLEPLVTGCWTQLDERERGDDDFAGDYLGLLSLLFRRYDTSPYRLPDVPRFRGKRNVLANPYSLKDTPAEPISAKLWDFFFADYPCMERLLMAGALGSPEARKLLCFLAWENRRALTFLVDCLLDHVYHGGSFEDLYHDFETIAAVVTVQDTLAWERIELFLYASPRDRRAVGLCRVPFIRRQQGAALGPDLFDHLMYVRLVVEVYHKAADIVRSVLRRGSEGVPSEERWTSWARSLLIRVHRHINSERAGWERWEELRDICGQDLTSIMDLEQLDVVLQEMADWEAPAGDEDDVIDDVSEGAGAGGEPGSESPEGAGDDSSDGGENDYPPGEGGRGGGPGRPPLAAVPAGGLVSPGGGGTKPPQPQRRGSEGGPGEGEGQDESDLAGGLVNEGPGRDSSGRRGRLGGAVSTEVPVVHIVDYRSEEEQVIEIPGPEEDEEGRPRDRD